MNDTSRRAGNEAGFSLTELAIYVFVIGIVAAVMAASVLSFFRSEETVSSLTNSASESQIFVNVLNQDLRSAREFAVRDGGETVIASVASKTNPVTWSCVTWAVADSGDDYTITRNGQAILEQAHPHDPDGTEGPEVALPFFATEADVTEGTEGILIYDFKVATSDSGVVEVRGVVSNEAQGNIEEAAHCV